MSPVGQISSSSPPGNYLSRPELADMKDTSFHGRRCNLLPARLHVMAKKLSKQLVKSRNSIGKLFTKKVNLFDSSKQLGESVPTCGYKDKNDLGKVWGEFSKQLNSSLDTALDDPMIALEAAVEDWALVGECKDLAKGVLSGFEKVDAFRQTSREALNSGKTEEANTALILCQKAHKSVSDDVEKLKQKLAEVSVLLDSRLNKINDRSKIQSSVQRIKKVLEQSSLVLDACVSQPVSHIGSLELAFNNIAPLDQNKLNKAYHLQNTHSNIAWAKAWVRIMKNEGDVPTFNRECQTVCRNIEQSALNYEKRGTVDTQNKADFKRACNVLSFYTHDKIKIEQDVPNKGMMLDQRLREITMAIERLEKNIPAQGSIESGLFNANYLNL